MPPTFVYILALIGYVAVAGAVWSVALGLAIPLRTRALARKLAAGMAGSFPGVFLFQILAAPLAAFVLLFAAGIARALDPEGIAVVVVTLTLALLAFAIFAVASVIGFYTGWRAAWEAASGRSPRAFLRSDRLLGPFVRFLHSRLPVTGRFL